MLTFRSALVAGSVAILVGASAHAVPINYGDFVAINVKYTQVTEDSGTDAPPLFGAPVLAGDGLDFNPVSFNANASGAGGVDITDGTLTFGVEAKPNRLVDGLAFSEAGDFTLAGFGGIGTFASVTADLYIDIIEIDNVSVTAIPIITAMVFTPSNGDWDLLNDGPGPAVHGSYTGGVTVDLTQVLIDEGVLFTNGVTGVTVTLDNTLVALSESGTESFIAKKDFEGFSVAPIIPEPSTGLLLGLGLVAVAGARRRH